MLLTTVVAIATTAASDTATTTVQPFDSTFESSFRCNNDGSLIIDTALSTTDCEQSASFLDNLLNACGGGGGNYGLSCAALAGSACAEEPEDFVWTGSLADDGNMYV